MDSPIYFIENGNELPESIPVNLIPSSVVACTKMLGHIRLACAHQRRPMVDKILKLIDPTFSDGKMRKDHSIDIILTLAEYKMLSADVAHFSAHPVHHHYGVDCKGMNTLLSDMVLAGEAAKANTNFML